MASPATDVSQGGHPAAFCSASTNLHDNLKDTDPFPSLKLPLLHSSRASPSRASPTTPFWFLPNPLLLRLRELEGTTHGPSGVESPAPATVFFELAQPILAAETGREHRLRGKQSETQKQNQRERGKDGGFVAPPSLLPFCVSLSLSLSLPSCEICGGFSRMSRTVVRHSRVPMGAASLFGVLS